MTTHPLNDTAHNQSRQHQSAEHSTAQAPSGMSELAMSELAMSELEWQTRTDLAAACRIVHHHGWTSQVCNHITARIPGTEALLINPFGHGHDEITPGNLVKIDIDGNTCNDSPYPVNLAGYTIHSAIHSARPDIQCIAHTYSQDVTRAGVSREISR